MSAEVLIGLCRWSAGSATGAAAVDLLALVARGRLLRPSPPWVRPCGRLGWFWLDPEPLVQLQGRPGRPAPRGAGVALLANGRTERPAQVQGQVVAA